MSRTANIPWIEKYRPTTFESIILSPPVRKILSNIIPLEHKDVPNLLFFGPPGTGKTTTIMRWISLYHTHHREHGRDLVLHLNASDERGLDTVRDRIEKFAICGNLFSVGMKFVIMDEFDAMTPSAQYAFKEVVSSVRHDVRFVVICNYIHRIERTIRDEFMNIEFTSIPRDETLSFLRMITETEGMAVGDEVLENIYSRFLPDIRSMINYIQSTRHTLMRRMLAETASLSLPDIHNIHARNEWILKQTESTEFSEFERALHSLAIHLNMGIRELMNGAIRHITERLIILAPSTTSSPSPSLTSSLAPSTHITPHLYQLKTLSHTTISLRTLLQSCHLLLRQILSSSPWVRSIPHNAPSASS